MLTIAELKTRLWNIPTAALATSWEDDESLTVGEESAQPRPEHRAERSRPRRRVERMLRIASGYAGSLLESPAICSRAVGFLWGYIDRLRPVISINHHQKKPTRKRVVGFARSDPARSARIRSIRFPLVRNHRSRRNRSIARRVGAEG